jgi:hypothetical protein
VWPIKASIGDEKRRLTAPKNWLSTVATGNPIPAACTKHFAGAAQQSWALGSAFGVACGIESKWRFGEKQKATLS